jgi:AcrR family transcriptional regulator
MSYEVLKTIRGRDYRYMVESWRDPETGKVRNTWRYLGKAGGDAPPRRRLAAAQTRAILAAALARLLEHTPWTEITAQAIAGEAGVTPGTLYRHFSSRDEVLQACAQDANLRLERHLTQLHVIASDVDAERARLRSWLFALWASGVPGSPARDRSAKRRRAFERYLELLWVHGYAAIAARDRAGVAIALALILDVQLRSEECAALADAVERLIFA